MGVHQSLLWIIKERYRPGAESIPLVDCGDHCHCSKSLDVTLRPLRPLSSLQTRPLSPPPPPPLPLPRCHALMLFSAERSRAGVPAWGLIAPQCRALIVVHLPRSPPWLTLCTCFALRRLLDKAFLRVCVCTAVSSERCCRSGRVCASMSSSSITNEIFRESPRAAGFSITPTPTASVAAP